MKKIKVTYKNGNTLVMECEDYLIDIANNNLYLCKAQSAGAMKPIKMDMMISIESLD